VQMASAAAKPLWLRTHWKNDRDELTHVLMNGGKLHVKDIDAFYEQYAHHVCGGHDALYVCELGRELFQFCIDVDLKCMLGENELRSCVQSVAQALHGIADWHGEIICNRCDGVDGRDGLHLIANGICVDSALAMVLRDGVVQKLMNNVRVDSVDWDGALDKAIYKAKGLRMPYSHKCVPCKNCKSKMKEHCEECMGFGKVDAGRAYLPYCTITIQEDGSHTMCMAKSISACTVTDVFAFLKKSTIRVAANVTKTELRTVMPEWLEANDGCDNRKPRRKRIMCSNSEKQNVSACVRDKIVAMLNAFIRTASLPDTYKGMEVGQIYYQSNKNKQRSIVITSNSKYCQNVKRFHTGNHVYFTITEMGSFFQRCLCPNETVEGRVCNVPCTMFHGSRYGHKAPLSVPQNTMNVLFPLSTNTSIVMGETDISAHTEIFVDARMTAMKTVVGCDQEY